MSSSDTSILRYLRSRSQIDIDSLDLEAARKGSEDGPWTDATSNQAEVYFQILKPENASHVARAIGVSENLHAACPDVTLSELKVEVVTVLLASRILPFIAGSVHVMVNPCYTFNTTKIIKTAHRYHQIFKHTDPNLDLSHVVIKVPASFEGLQACRELSAAGVKALATTVFTMEQAVLAGEVGCVSISPFVHELKAEMDSTYKDTDPILDLCVKAQKYYQLHSIPTKVKACSCMSTDEIIQLAGVAAHTIPPDYLELLAPMKHDRVQLDEMSLFRGPGIANEVDQQWLSYVDDEARYRVDFAARDGGRGQLRMNQAISIFCDFQHKAELKMSGLDTGR